MSRIRILSTPAKVLFGFVAAIIILGVALELLWLAQHNSYERYPLSGACYSVFDRNGVEHKSWFPPVPASDGGGIFTFNNDHKWGYVFGPSAMVADRDCLRERGVDVPSLNGSDE